MESLGAFVARRKGDWEKLQQLLAQQRSGALELGQLKLLDSLYRRATGDLAYAQSFFPGTDAHRFLNQLCGSAYGSIYQPPRQHWTAVRQFHENGFPGVFRAEKLVNMGKHDYRLEPNVSFSPDEKWVVFRSNMLGQTYAFAVEVEKK